MAITAVITAMTMRAATASRFAEESGNFTVLIFTHSTKLTHFSSTGALFAHYLPGNRGMPPGTDHEIPVTSKEARNSSKICIITETFYSVSIEKSTSLYCP